MSEFLFVYGTLLPELAPKDLWPVICRLPISEKATVSGWLYDLGKYPGAILNAETDARIHGAVFELPEELLMTLDDYEGFERQDLTRSLFVRKRCPVTLNSGRNIECWIYEYNRAANPAQIIESGNYSAHLASKRAVNN